MTQNKRTLLKRIAIRREKNRKRMIRKTRIRRKEG